MSFSDAHSRSDRPADGASAGPDPVVASGVSEVFASEANYAVKLPLFEGPLDLLLHLIRQNEVDITDIPVALIAEQYLSYIELMQELNIDVAAEYLVMAATLALIKSRMLLPPDGEEEEGEELDPRAELVARLLEYQRFKEAAEELSRRRWLGRDIFEAQGPEPERTPDAERELEVGLFELLEAFREVLAQARGPAGVHEVETEKVTVRDRMIDVMDRLESGGPVEFMEIFRSDDGGLPSRTLLVATFLAILELAKLMALHIYQGTDEQGAPEGAIRLRAREKPEDALDWRQQITETM